MKRIANGLGVVAWFAFLALALITLARLGAVLPVPQPSQISSWYIDTPSSQIAFTVVRVLCMLGCTYLLAASVLATVAELFRADLSFRPLSGLPIRRLVRNTVGVSLVASTLTPMSSVEAAVDVRGYPVLHHVDPNATTTTTTTTQLDESEVGNASPEVDEAPVAPPALESHTVVAGDSLWSIAEETLVGRGQAADTTTIAAFVNEIAKLNGAEFADPGNHDLIFPGQVFRLPQP